MTTAQAGHSRPARASYSVCGADRPGRHWLWQAVAGLLAAVVVLPVTLGAQPANTPANLTSIVAALDAALFDAYNACDMQALDRMVADDLEFFHDADGLSVGKRVFLDSTRRNICGKVRRDLVPGSLEVYPLGQYGALEVGVHRFHHPGAAADDAGEGRFVIVWRRTDTGWVMTRTISFAHHPLSQ